MSEVDTGTTRWARKQNDWDCFGFFTKKKKKKVKISFVLFSTEKKEENFLLLSLSLAPELAQQQLKNWCVL